MEQMAWQTPDGVLRMAVQKLRGREQRIAWQNPPRSVFGMVDWKMGWRWVASSNCTGHEDLHAAC
jgi:hypothetical protein